MTMIREYQLSSCPVLAAEKHLLRQAHESRKPCAARQGISVPSVPVRSILRRDWKGETNLFLGFRPGCIDPGSPTDFYGVEFIFFGTAGRRFYLWHGVWE